MLVDIWRPDVLKIEGRKLHFHKLQFDPRSNNDYTTNYTFL